MNRARLALVLTTLPLATGCALLLDFDALQNGEASGGSPGTGSAGAAGTAGTAGAAGAASTCDPSCDDGDPCTRDTCDAEGACLHLSAGVAPDGMSEVVDVGAAVNVNLVANEVGFILAVAYDTTERRDAQLFTVERNGAVLTPGATLGALLGDDTVQLARGTRVALATLPAQPFTTGVFAAALTDASATVADVYAIQTDSSLNVVTRERVSTALVSRLPVTETAPGRGPIAWAIGGQVHGAWVGENARINLRTLGATANRPIDPGEAVTAIAPIGNTQQEPGVLWFSATPHAQFPGGSAATELFTCPTGAGLYYTASASATSVPGLWVSAWTRAVSATRYGSEIFAVACSGSTCSVVDEDVCDAQPSPVFNPSVAVTAIQGEPDVLYYFVLSPTSDGDTTTLSLAVLRLHLTDPAQSYALTPPAGITVTTAPTAGGPDWPVVAVAPPNKVAIAYATLNPTTGRREARFERFDFCEPTPDDLAGKRP